MCQDSVLVMLLLGVVSVSELISLWEDVVVLKCSEFIAVIIGIAGNWEYFT